MCSNSKIWISSFFAIKIPSNVTKIFSISNFFTSKHINKMFSFSDNAPFNLSVKAVFRFFCNKTNFSNTMTFWRSGFKDKSISFNDLSSFITSASSFASLSVDRLLYEKSKTRIPCPETDLLWEIIEDNSNSLSWIFVPTFFRNYKKRKYYFCGRNKKKSKHKA